MNYLDHNGILNKTNQELPKVAVYTAMLRRHVIKCNTNGCVSQHMFFQADYHTDSGPIVGHEKRE